tara:strand:+ start:6702 stop:7496 length:795 start_codon:yes stop_codon:yes gene_type:complete
MDKSSGITLAGRRILVTGAGGGIGLAIAEKLVGAGAQVILNDISAAPLRDAKERIGAAGALVGDVSDESSVKKMFAEMNEMLGGIDGLVNNAGIADPLRGTKRQTLADWRRVMDVNVQGCFLMLREAASYMPPGSAIVNIASVVGLGGFAASNGYGVSKAAIVMMTKTTATDFARFGIRVNAVAPGVIEAPMASEILGGGSLGTDPYVRRIPMGRLGKPEEIGNAVQFLLSGMAEYITGVTLPVDGGWMAFGGAGDASHQTAAG